MNNELCKKKNEIPVENTKNTVAERAVRKLIERERESKEHSQQIVNHYRR